MRFSIDMDRVRAAVVGARIPEGADAARFVKKRVLGGALRQLDRIDPEVAASLMAAQGSLFAAGKAFFEEELGHARRAEEKFRRKAAEARGASVPQEAAEAPVESSAPDAEERIDPARPD